MSTSTRVILPYRKYNCTGTDSMNYPSSLLPYRTVPVALMCVKIYYWSSIFFTKQKTKKHHK